MSTVDDDDDYVEVGEDGSVIVSFKGLNNNKLYWSAEQRAASANKEIAEQLKQASSELVGRWNLSDNGLPVLLRLLASRNASIANDRRLPGLLSQCIKALSSKVSHWKADDKEALAVFLHDPYQESIMRELSQAVEAQMHVNDMIGAVVSFIGKNQQSFADKVSGEEQSGPRLIPTKGKSIPSALRKLNDPYNTRKSLSMVEALCENVPVDLSEFDMGTVDLSVWELLRFVYKMKDGKEMRQPVSHSVPDIARASIILSRPSEMDQVLECMRDPKDLVDYLRENGAANSSQGVVEDLTKPRFKDNWTAALFGDMQIGYGCFTEGVEVKKSGLVYTLLRLGGYVPEGNKKGGWGVGEVQLLSRHMYQAKNFGDVCYRFASKLREIQIRCKLGDDSPVSQLIKQFQQYESQLYKVAILKDVYNSPHPIGDEWKKFYCNAYKGRLQLENENGEVKFILDGVEQNLLDKYGNKIGEQLLKKDFSELFDSPLSIFNEVFGSFTSSIGIGLLKSNIQPLQIRAEFRDPKALKDTIMRTLGVTADDSDELVRMIGEIVEIFNTTSRRTTQTTKVVSTVS